MASYGGSYSSSSQSYAPSAPSLPDSYNQTYNSYTTSPPPPAPAPAPAPAYYGQFPPQQQQQQPYQVPGYGQVLSHGHNSFPPGTHPDVIRNFEMVDRDRSGFIDEKELQQALSSGYQKFSIGTIRLLMFLFKNPHDSLRIGEFSCFFFLSLLIWLFKITKEKILEFRLLGNDFRYLGEKKIRFWSRLAFLILMEFFISGK